jgi:UDP-4-amino-4,6-dideoxy-N-acetyl-beta-L-altrosamine N-acetyltransferase
VIELVDCAEEHRWLLLKWRNSSMVAPYMYDRGPISEKVHDAWYSQLLKRDRRRGWVITMGEQPVGAAFITDHSPENRRASFGLYLADKSTRGRGVGTAAQYLLCEQAFDGLALHKLCCEAFSFNDAAVMMYKAVGFEEEGLLRDHYYRDGDWVHVHALAMLENTWADRREQLATNLKERGLIS